MGKRVILATLAVFAAWSVLDIVIHWMILGGSYEATANLWRPMGEMKMGLIYLTGFIMALSFVYIYAEFFKELTVASGLRYGLLFGIVVGAGMGYGTYASMPIPFHMALVWFFGTVVEMMVGGVLVGLIVPGRSVGASEPSGQRGTESNGDL